MKQLLLSSLVLLMFSISILLFQVSCKKDATAGPTGITQLNKISYLRVNATTTLPEIWLANYDGSGQSVVNITLPVGAQIRGESISLSPDGQKLFFSVYDGAANKIYVCDADGSNLTPIVTSSTDMKFGNAQ